LKADIILETSFSKDLAINWTISQSSIDILWYLLENKDNNAYEIRKNLKKRSATIDKAIKKQLLPSKEIKISKKRPSKKNKNIIATDYCLTKIGYLLIVNLFYINYDGTDEMRIDFLTKIFSSVKRNYPEFIPEIFRKLPTEYCVIFYPFTNLLDNFISLLKAGYNEKEKKEFLLKNRYFELKVPLNKKEKEIILNYANKKIKETEQNMKTEIANFKKKKNILKKIIAESQHKQIQYPII
jgi:hypothetical protein